MNTLLVREREVATVFDLLGERENDITFAIGFALSRSSRFLRRVLGSVGAPQDFSELVAIDLQLGDRRDRGFTDIDLTTDSTFPCLQGQQRATNNGRALPTLASSPRIAAHASA